MALATDCLEVESGIEGGEHLFQVKRGQADKRRTRTLAAPNSTNENGKSNYKLAIDTRLTAA